jgi:hypothetical protein
MVNIGEIEANLSSHRTLLSAAGTGIVLLLLIIFAVTDDLTILAISAAISAVYVIIQIDNRILIAYGILFLICSALDLNGPSSSNYAVLAFWLFGSGLASMLVTHFRSVHHNRSSMS